MSGSYGEEHEDTHNSEEEYQDSYDNDTPASSHSSQSDRQADQGCLELSLLFRRDTAVSDLPDVVLSPSAA